MDPIYVGWRMVHTAVTLLLVSLLVFAITQILPGNAAHMVLGEFATPEAVHALEERLGLTAPWFIQYGRWLAGILSWDWGTSLSNSQPVLRLVAQDLSRSLVLAASSLLLVTAVAIPVGIIAALRRGTLTDMGISLFSYVGVSMPEFVVATLLLVLLARPEIGIFPAGGYEPLSAGLWPFLSHLILPSLALAIILMAHISRQTRSEMVDVMQQDYIRTAVLKGLPRRRVVMRHALRNAMIPTITVIALDVGYLMGGILVVEEVFAYPGLGRLLVSAMQNRDLPLLQGAVLVVAACYALANLLADIAYATLDRRIRYE
ncbi:ABC transporter permease [Microvirga massiliensis]|uniref:ABC transporter permease n=1 Tax=Microvirga massiliensis TaxID=1033741 RepID=UPI00062B95A8|nr:ABC transporter permease [Microvirga massiliensis]